MKNTKVNGYVQIQTNWKYNARPISNPYLSMFVLQNFKVIFCIVFASKPVLKVITIYNTLTLYKFFLLLSLCTQSDIFFYIYFVLTSCST